MQEDVIGHLPRSEKYELASQLRRSSTSIPFNIAEGWARPTRVYINHLSIALGSEAELKTQTTGRGKKEIRHRRSDRAAAVDGERGRTHDVRTHQEPETTFTTTPPIPDP